MNAHNRIRKRNGALAMSFDTIFGLHAEIDREKENCIQSKTHTHKYTHKVLVECTHANNKLN